MGCSEESKEPVRLAPGACRDPGRNGGGSKGSHREGIWLRHALTVSHFLRKTGEGSQQREPRLERAVSRGRLRHGTPDEAGRRGQRRRHNPDKK